MRYVHTTLDGVLLCQPDLYHDRRGFFFESWNNTVFSRGVGEVFAFVQDNRSHSLRDVLRGLHYQIDPMAQGKLVGVSHGRIFDVCVDLRRSSLTFGQSFGCVLDADSATQIWIPPGLAHGFLVLSSEADVWYKTTQYYSPYHERCIRWDDPALQIQWPLDGRLPIVSQKDFNGQLLIDASTFER